MRCLTLPDRFQDHGSQEDQLVEAKLDRDGIFSEIKNVISKLKISPQLTNKTG